MRLDVHIFICVLRQRLSMFRGLLQMLQQQTHNGGMNTWTTSRRAGNGNDCDHNNLRLDTDISFLSCKEPKTAFLGQDAMLYGVVSGTLKAQKARQLGQ